MRDTRSERHLPKVVFPLAVADLAIAPSVAKVLLQLTTLFRRRGHEPPRKFGALAGQFVGPDADDTVLVRLDSVRAEPAVTQTASAASSIGLVDRFHPPLP